MFVVSPLVPLNLSLKNTLLLVARGNICNKWYHIVRYGHTWCSSSRKIFVANPFPIYKYCHMYEFIIRNWCMCVYDVYVCTWWVLCMALLTIVASSSLDIWAVTLTSPWSLLYVFRNVTLYIIQYNIQNNAKYSMWHFFSLNYLKIDKFSSKLKIWIMACIFVQK